MATDVDVQYFSHLNGLMLGNNWGDLIRLLDTCLVNGLPLTSITSASIDEQGDIHLTTYAAHNSMLFQIIELGGFAPAELNGKYRIKGVPTANELILKAEHLGKVITTIGVAKLASLGYEIIFRDIGDVKRVYRAKNPTAQYPFIRVDETISDGMNSYNSAYAKYAMVGLLEHMDHIDDYQNPDVLQLPFDPVDPAKNWKITGAGTDVMRGWSRWYWAHINNFASGDHRDADAPSSISNFCIVGDKDAFYIAHGVNSQNNKILYGCGIFNKCLDDSVVPSWFLQTSLKYVSAGTYYNLNISANNAGFSPLCMFENRAAFFTTAYNSSNKLTSHDLAKPILPDYLTGLSTLFPGGEVAALEVPFSSGGYLRGTLKHVAYAGKSLSPVTTPAVTLADSSMYLCTSLMCVDNATNGGVYFYLGELE